MHQTQSVEDEEEEEDMKKKLFWLFSETFSPEHCSYESLFGPTAPNQFLVEIGPRLDFATAWNSNVLSIFNSCGIVNVDRVERSKRYLVTCTSPLECLEMSAFVASISDKMTEILYSKPLETFHPLSLQPEAVKVIPVLSEGISALVKINSELQLGLDEFDLNFYKTMYEIQLKRDPTDVELFDLANSNSEHSR